MKALRKARLNDSGRVRRSCSGSRQMRRRLQIRDTISQRCSNSLLNGLGAILN